ncbi:hypothetical protein [Sphingomonas psychrotolerans]|nr:hypothetical protein [Sphingomonas psychrotolerans]
MRLFLTMGLALALAACGGGDEVVNNSVTPAPTPTPGPMLGGVDLSKPVRATGTGVPWSMDIAPGTIAFLAAPKAARADFYPVSPKLAEGRAVFETQTPEAEPVTITMTGEACTAGKRRLPLAVAARIGTRTLQGCAGPIDYVGQP